MFFFFFFYYYIVFFFFFFFSSRRRHTRWNCDWSSDVCSSDLLADPGGLVHHQRVAARGEIAAVDRDLAPAPHAIVAAKAHPVSDDHVRLGGVGGGAAAVVDRGPLRGDHLHRVAHAGDGAVVGEIRPAQHRVVAAIHGHHPVV